MSSFNSRKTLAKFCIFSRKNECIYFKLRFYFRDNLIYSNNKLHFVVVLCGYKCVDHCRKHALPTSSMHDICCRAVQYLHSPYETPKKAFYCACFKLRLSLIFSSVIKKSFQTFKENIVNFLQ